MSGLWRRSRLIHSVARLFCAAVLISACAEETPPPRDPFLQDSLGIDPLRVVHEVLIGGARDEEHLVPGALTVSDGEVVILRTIDHRVHTITFLRDSLSAASIAFLARRVGFVIGPLVERGSSVVIDFEGAPSGRYAFVSEGSGGRASGAITVSAAEDGG